MNFLYAVTDLYFVYSNADALCGFEPFPGSWRIPAVLSDRHHPHADMAAEQETDNGSAL